MFNKQNENMTIEAVLGFNTDVTGCAQELLRLRRFPQALPSAAVEYFDLSQAFPTAAAALRFSQLQHGKFGGVGGRESCVQFGWQSSIEKFGVLLSSHVENRPSLSNTLFNV